jgi:hypothetical protein
MSKNIKISNGDYSIQVQTGGNIVLDTTGTTAGRSSANADQGTVTIWGNLDVKGVTTQVESKNTTISDPLIQVNVGQTGATINNTNANPHQAGIEISRGSGAAAQLVYDEDIAWYDNRTSTSSLGGFSLHLSNDTYLGLKVTKIALSTNPLQDLVFDLQNSNKALRVANYSGTYVSSVTVDDHIPSYGFLKQYIASTYNGGGQGQAIVGAIQDTTTGTTSSIVATTNTLTFTIGGTSSKLTASGLSITGRVRAENVQVASIDAPNTITTLNPLNSDHVTTSSDNLILTSYTGNVEVDGVLNLQDQSSTPSSTSAINKVYSSATQGTGSTGLYFANTKTSGELISSKKALLYAILF